MINFDGVDFSERRAEEVISFFWCSVQTCQVVRFNRILSDFQCKIRMYDFSCKTTIFFWIFFIFFMER